MNCKISRTYYSYDFLVKLANKLGYNKNGKRAYFLAGNLFCDNIFNPVIIFDTEKHEWNKQILNS